MWSAVELPNVHHIALVLEHRRFVVVDIEVVRCREDRHDGGKTGGLCLTIHPIAGILCFVRSDDGK